MQCIFIEYEIFFPSTNNFPERLQLICTGISSTEGEVSLSASGNKIAHGIAVLGGTCWPPLTELAQMCDISGSVWKKGGVSSLTAKVSPELFLKPRPLSPQVEEQQKHDSLIAP